MTVEKSKNSGAVVALQDQHYPGQQGFSIEDIVWAVGIWSVILTLAPAIVFYVLMVA